MKFLYTEVLDIKEEASQILKRMGHKFSEDSWYQVLHGDTYDKSYIDAISMNCTEPDCAMRFDINSSFGNSFLLWNHCRTIAEFIITPHGFDVNDYVKTTPKQFLPYCKKFLVMT